MDFSNIACWIWPLIAGVLCGILGYLLGRLSGSSGDDSNYKAALEDCNRKNASLQADLDACHSKLNIARSAPAAASTSSSMSSSFAAGAAATAASLGSTDSGITAVPFNADAAKAAFGKKIKQDDLTVVEGIGPKIAELFQNHDVKTWAGLANTSVDRCQEILNTGGKRYEIHRPGTWPMQAEMAALGKWEALKKWQDEHDYGKA